MRALQLGDVEILCVYQHFLFAPPAQAGALAANDDLLGEGGRWEVNGSNDEVACLRDAEGLAPVAHDPGGLRLRQSAYFIP